MWVQCMCVPGYPTCVCIRGWRPVCMQDVQVRQWRTIDRAGHDRDGDEAEYDDEDKEPCPQRLHNPTHAQGEGGDVFV